MRKKYLSALLFGALLVTSAGTFTSCKDYDDDINNLQEQITANADAIKALQDKINSGKWITELTSVEGGFKVTFSDGQSFEIVNGEDGAAGANGSEWTIGEDGFWYKDGVKTQYQAAIGEATGKVVVPTIKDGIWYIVDEETGELVATEYKANGAAYAVAEANGGYTIYMPNEEGTELQEIFIPGAAAAITSIEAALIETDRNNLLNVNYFSFDNEGAKEYANLTGKTIPAIKYILTSDESFGVRVNPVNVDAAAVEFQMINSKNEVLPFVKFTAQEYKEYITTEGTEVSRAAYGNGLYTLTMKKVEVKDDAALKTLTDLQQVSNKNIAYAVSADLACRGEYNVGVDVSEASADFGAYKINNVEITETVLGSNPEADNKDTTVDIKATNTVSVETPSHLYDMWLSAAEEDVNLFDLQFDQEKHTFSVNADPDMITKSSFDLIISTLDNNGNFKQVYETINVSSKIVAEAEYAKITHNIVAEDNFFTADMATMTTALGSQLDTWKKNVSKAMVDFYTDEDCTTIVENKSGVSLSFLSSDNKETALNAANNAVIKAASQMKFTVNNDNHGSFVVDKTYYAKVTFSGAQGDLNSVVIPFEFKIPALSTLFTVKEGYINDGVINAYFYNTEVASPTEVASTAVELDKYFSKYVDDAIVAFDNTNNVEGTESIAEDLFEFSTNTDFSSVTLDLKNDFDAEDNEVPQGYGKAITVNVTKGEYLGWDYETKGDNTYSFNIRMLSPIYEGSVVPADGNVITINGNDLVNGALITDKDIIGMDYNGNTYNVVADKVDELDTNSVLFANPQIKEVNPGLDADKYIKSAVMTPATQGENGVVNGAIKLTGESISNTVTVEMPITVTDAWGYKLSQKVSVKIVKN